MSRYVCSWCGADLREARTAEDSHGVCRRCERRMLREIPFWQRVRATAAVDGWSGVFGQALIYVVLGLWVLALVREGLRL